MASYFLSFLDFDLIDAVSCAFPSANALVSKFSRPQLDFLFIISLLYAKRQSPTFLLDKVTQDIELQWTDSSRICVQQSGAFRLLTPSQEVKAPLETFVAHIGIPYSFPFLPCVNLCLFL